MQTFTPYEYVLIAIANANGMDKCKWDERIDFADKFVTQNSYEAQLEYAKHHCDEEPLLMAKAINAHNDIINGLETGFMCNLDATASGLQIMAAVTGCSATAEKVNLINNGERNDIYRDIASDMNTQFGTQVERSMLKQPIMTFFYGSTAEPKAVFGEDTPELSAFYGVLQNDLKGAFELLQVLKNMQCPHAQAYKWVLPDGHTAYVPVMQTEDKRIEVEELNKATFTFRTKVNKPKSFDLSIAANVIHSLDAYIVRQLYRRAQRKNYRLMTIHDSFWAHPNHIEDVRKGYRYELAQLCKQNVIEDILNQLSGKKGTFNQYSKNLHEAILQADYALS